MDDGPAGSILLFLIFIVLSAYFSGAEISLASVNKIHMISRADKGNKGAGRVLYILDHFEEALSVLLIGNNVVNIGCATISAVIAAKIWGGFAVSVSTVLTTIVIFIFGEMLPKCFARSCNEAFAEKASAPLIFLMKILKPFSFFFTKLSALVSAPFKKRTETQVTVTEDELQDIVENISEEDGFDEERGRLVKSALRFSDSTAADVMTPWEQVQTVSTSFKRPQLLEEVKNSVHSRIPVVDRKGTIKGVLSIRKFLKAYTANPNLILASVMDYPFYTRPDMPIDELLPHMSDHRRNLAFVRSEEGGILGIVTVEAILEELVGEIYDESDEAGDAHE